MRLFSCGGVKFRLLLYTLILAVCIIQTSYVCVFGCLTGLFLSWISFERFRTIETERFPASAELSFQLKSSIYLQLESI